MKKMITLLTIVLATRAYAVSENSSWEQIKSLNNIKIESPTIAFDAGAAITFVSVLDTCVRGQDEIQTNEKMNIYKHIQIGHKNDIEAIGTMFLTHPRTYTHLVWRKLPGSSTETQVELSETIETDYKIDVYEKSLGSSKLGRKLFAKEYSIPFCK